MEVSGEARVLSECIQQGQSTSSTGGLKVSSPWNRPLFRWISTMADCLSLRPIPAFHLGSSCRSSFSDIWEPVSPVAPSQSKYVGSCRRLCYNRPMLPTSSLSRPVSHGQWVGGDVNNGLSIHTLMLLSSITSASLDTASSTTKAYRQPPTPLRMAFCSNGHEIIPLDMVHQYSRHHSCQPFV